MCISNPTNHYDIVVHIINLEFHIEQYRVQREFRIVCRPDLTSVLCLY